jgi:hypothetical protein
VAVGAVRKEIGVREPPGMFDAVNDHVNLITLRIPSWASISAKPLLASSRVNM